MSTVITTINSTDLITNSRADINANFSSLNSNKIETSVLDTDTSMAANSDAKIPSQKAVKAYVDTGGNANASETVRGIVQEATDAQVTAGTATGGTGAKLVVTPAKLATILALYSKLITRTNGLTTRAQGASSSTDVIAHGLGAAPRYVKLTGVMGATSTVQVTSIGSWNANGQNCVWVGEAGTTGASGSSNTQTIVLPESNSASQGQVGVVTVDATNITITWTKVGTPSAGTASILWEAET